jgi:hypothetical protein
MGDDGTLRSRAASIATDMAAQIRLDEEAAEGVADDGKRHRQLPRGVDPIDVDHLLLGDLNHVSGSLSSLMQDAGAATTSQTSTTSGRGTNASTPLVNTHRVRTLPRPDETN